MACCFVPTRNEMNLALFGKADKNHTHTGYAATSHTHNYADPAHVHDYADPAHTHDYADPAHTHNYADPAHTHNYADPAHTHDYAATSHTHNYADPAHTHTGYAATSHTHNYADPAHVHDDRYFTESEVTTALAGKSNTSHTHPRTVGEITMWPTDTAPSGWLLCAGQAVSRSTYSALFALIGTTFGTGNGSTTFNLPDMRGRLPLGQDDMGGSSANRVTAAAADSIGGSGGAETHTLSATEMPAHNHNIFRNGGAGSGYIVDVVGNAIRTEDGGYLTNTGGGSPHNNMPPYLVINFIIYTGV